MHCMQLILFYTFYWMKCFIFTVYKAIYSILYIQCTVLNLLHTIWCTPSIIYILWIIMCTYPYGVSDFQNVFKCLQQVSHVVTYRSKNTGTLIFVIRKILLRVPQGEVSPQKWNLTVMSYMLWVLFGLA